MRATPGSWIALPSRSVASRASVATSPGYGRTPTDCGVDHRRIGGEPIEADRAGDIHRVEQAVRVGNRERCPTGREGVVVEERGALAGRELQVADEGDGELGQGREIRLTDRSSRVDARCLARVQRGDEPLGELRADTRRALGEVVGEPEDRGPDDVVRNHWALADEMMGEHPRGVPGRVAGGHVDPFQDADPGRRAVDRRPGLDRGHDDRVGPLHPGAGAGIEPDGLAAAGNPDQRAAIEVVPGEVDRHGRRVRSVASGTNEPAGGAGGFMQVRLRSRTRAGRWP